MTFKDDHKQGYATPVQSFEALNQLRDHCHGTAISAGWYRDLVEALHDARDHADTRKQIIAGAVGLRFALIHSEISEALEGYRKDKQDDHIPDLPAVDVELADALIRIFDLAGYLGCDLATAVERKMAYNKTRHDHTKEAREAPDGKRF